MEYGTHAVVDAGFWPYHTSERVGRFRLLRSVTAGMLVMWDRGLHDYDMLAQTRQRGAHVLSRLPAHVKPQVVRPLADGSYLAYLRSTDYQRRKQGERLLVRVIEYTLTDPNLPDYGETHRLVTTLLDPETFPILDLICAYHECWEVEIIIDEIDTHQRLLPGPVRSLKPVGVIQELYGFLRAHYIIRAFAGDDRYAVDYLISEVIERQPAHIQEFLLKTGFLRRLKASLCDAVTERDDGRGNLNHLEAANVPKVKGQSRQRQATTDRVLMPAR